MKAIAAEYASYLEVVFPGQEEIDITQQIEMRRAFMAGALSMFVLVNKATELSEDEACEKLSEFNQELHEFTLMVQAGLA